MGQAKGQVAVVGDDQQPLGVGVEPTGGVEPRPGLPEQIDDRLAAPRIPHGRERAAGLVHEKVDARLHPQRPAVEGDGGGFRVYGKSGVESDSAVNLDPAGPDKVDRFAAGGHAGDGDEL